MTLIAGFAAAGTGSRLASIGRSARPVAGVAGNGNRPACRGLAPEPGP